MAGNLERLGEVAIVEFEESKFIQPQTAMYELDGKMRRWCAVGRVLQDHAHLWCTVDVLQQEPLHAATNERTITLSCCFTGASCSECCTHVPRVLPAAHARSALTLAHAKIRNHGVQGHGHSS